MKGSRYGVKTGARRSDRVRVRSVLGVEVVTTPATPAACLVFTPEEMDARVASIHARVAAEAPHLFRGRKADERGDDDDDA